MPEVPFTPYVIASCSISDALKVPTTKGLASSVTEPASGACRAGGALRSSVQVDLDGRPAVYLHLGGNPEIVAKNYP